MADLHADLAALRDECDTALAGEIQANWNTEFDHGYQAAVRFIRNRLARTLAAHTPPSESERRSCGYCAGEGPCCRDSTPPSETATEERARCGRTDQHPLHPMPCDSRCQPDWHKDWCAIYDVCPGLDPAPPSSSDADIAALVERSSFGTEEAAALRATVSDETAARIVARSKEIEADADRDAGLSEAAVHRAFHDAWPGPSVPLDLYADSPIWVSMAEALAARAQPEGTERVRPVGWTEEVQWGVRAQSGAIYEVVDERWAWSMVGSDHPERVFRRTVTEFAPVVSEWGPVDATRNTDDHAPLSEAKVVDGDE